jgi:hypothetical protein
VRRGVDVQFQRERSYGVLPLSSHTKRGATPERQVSWPYSPYCCDCTGVVLNFARLEFKGKASCRQTVTLMCFEQIALPTEILFAASRAFHAQIGSDKTRRDRHATPGGAHRGASAANAPVRNDRMKIAVYHDLTSGGAKRALTESVSTQEVNAVATADDAAWRKRDHPGPNSPAAVVSP